MSYEDTIQALKVISTVALGQYAGASVYSAIAIQPSLIEQDDAQAASKTMRSVLKKSSGVMPLAQLLSSSTALAVYFKTRGTPKHDSYWLTSGLTLLAMIPYTVVLMGPVSSQFRDNEEKFEGDSEKWNTLLSEWLTFHTPRAAIALALFSVGVYKLTAK